MAVRVNMGFPFSRQGWAVGWWAHYDCRRKIDKSGEVICFVSNMDTIAR
jgi:hypothetical protein